MKAKKILAVLLGAAMAVSVAACGSSSDSATTDVSATEEDTTVTAEEENVSDETGGISEEEESDVSAEEESSTDEVGGVSGEYTAADLGITEEDMEKIYAVFAYELSTHDLDATYLENQDDEWWYNLWMEPVTSCTANLGLLNNLQFQKADHPELLKYDNCYVDSHGGSVDSFENLTVKYSYYVLISSSSDYSELPIGNSSIYSAFQKLVKENVTCSEEQIATGEQIISELPAEYE